MRRRCSAKTVSVTVHRVTANASLRLVFCPFCSFFDSDILSVAHSDEPVIFTFCAQIPFWTPNIRSTSTSKMSSSRKSLRSATPDRAQSKSAEIPKSAAFSEMPVISLDPSTDDVVDGEDSDAMECDDKLPGGTLTLDVPSKESSITTSSNTAASMSNGAGGGGGGLKVDSLCLSPIQLFHGRSLRKMARDAASADGPAMNPIFKTISAATNETESTRTTSTEEDDDTDHLEDDGNVRGSVGDVDPLMFQHHISVQPEQDEVTKSTVDGGGGITDVVDGVNALDISGGPVPFDSLDLDAMTAKSVQSKRNGMSPTKGNVVCLEGHCVLS